MRGRQTVIEAWKLLYYLPCTTGTWPASSFQSSFAPRSKQVRTGRVSPSDGKITPTSISVTPVSMTARIRTRSRSRSMALARHWGSYLNGRRRLHGRLIRRMPNHLVQSTTPAELARPPRRRLKQGLPPSSPPPLPFLPFARILGIHQSQICRLEGNSTVPSTITVKVKWVSEIFVPGSQNTLASGCDKFAPALAFLFGLVLPSKI